MHLSSIVVVADDNMNLCSLTHLMHQYQTDLLYSNLTKSLMMPKWQEQTYEKVSGGEDDYSIRKKRGGNIW